MKIKITEKNFFKTLEKISNKRYAAMDDVDKLFKDMWSKKNSSNLSHHVWSSLALELYLCSRPEEAEKAQLEAIRIQESLVYDEESILGALYGDLAMIYEKLDRYDDAYKYMQKSLEISIKERGENYIFSKLRKENLKRLSKFKEYSFKNHKKILEELSKENQQN